jgi:hypothetical protein
MILIDYSQISIAAIMAQTRGEMPGIGMVRHTILNTIRMVNHKYKGGFGRIVLCCDGKDSWRKSKFAYYKANRKSRRADSKINWELLFDMMSQVRKEIAEYFPYQVLHIDHVEADDIIAVLCRSTSDPVLIYSGDKDFLQLQTMEHVIQVSPLHKDLMLCRYPEEYLRRHILGGDTGDGIPNVLSEDDCLCEESKRQKPLRQSKIDTWVGMDEDSLREAMTEKEFRNFKRNELLIDLNRIPDDIVSKIEDAFSQEYNQQYNGLSTYFNRNGLTTLLPKIQEF